MNVIHLAKRGLLPLLVLIPFLSFAADVKIYENKIWKNLLHLNNNDKPSINSPTFLLSYVDFSPKNELDKTIEVFKNDYKMICKYPARYLWLSENMKLKLDNFDLSSCSEFSNYRKKTNPKNISLVFASQNVTNPSSMMGHVFFKLDGTNDKNEKVQNAVSFYTIIETFNLPYLALESIVLGMRGYFVLKPYNKQIYTYVVNEKRNIWEYELDLTKEQIELLTYHFWELKDIDITYYFTGYNCATIVDDMLNLLSKENVNETSNLWITPKDVIKKASKNKLIKETRLIGDINKEKNPINTLNDSQVSLKSSDNSLYLSFLPASHTIYDDNSYSSFESSLKIGEVSLKIKKDEIKLDELNFYSMKLLTPWDNQLKNLSKGLEINYTKQYDDQLNQHYIYNLFYSSGITYKFNNSFYIYDLFGAGLAYGNDVFYPYLKNEFGVIIYFMDYLKINISHTSYFNTFKSSDLIHTIDATQSFYLSSDMRLDLTYKNNYTNKINDNSFGVGLSYIF